MFSCWFGGGGGGSGGGCGSDGGRCGGDSGDGGSGDGGSGDGGGGGGGDFGGEECFHGLFMGFLLEVGCLPHFPMKRVGTFYSRNVPVLLYSHWYQVSQHLHH